MNQSPPGYRYSIENGVLYLRLIDAVSIETVEKMLEKLSKDTAFLDSKINASLVDLRGVKTLLTMPSDYTIFSEQDKKLKSIGVISPDARTAVIVSKVMHEWAIKLLSLVASRQGSAYQSFRSLDSACQWIDLDRKDVPDFIRRESDGFVDEI